jgi:23S rRNA G2445 N2-methylase RlmL
LICSGHSFAAYSASSTPGRPGQAIYDPFLGSGTSLIAAEMTGRVCFGLELNPAYGSRQQMAAFHRGSGKSGRENVGRRRHR